MFFDPDDYLPATPAAEPTKRQLRAARQRALLCRCMVQLAAEQGYEAASVQKAVRLSGLGKGTFYGLFESGEACLLEAFERCAETIFARVDAAGREGGDDFAGRLKAGLGALLELLASEPEVARFVLVEIRVGVACREAEQRWLQRFAALLVDVDGGDAERRSEGLAWITAGAIASLLALRVAKTGPEALTEMLDELVFVALLPRYGARAEAAKGLDTATPPPPGSGVPKARGKSRKATRPFERGAQRQLLLGVMAELVGAKGYEATRVEDVSKRSKLSKFTFYTHFASKEACLLAAFDAAIERIAERMEAAMTDGGIPAAQTEAGLRSMLDSFAAQPGLARLLTVEVRKIGAGGEAHYGEALARFARAFAEASGDQQAAGEVPELVAASVASAIAREVGEGRAGQLEGLLPELLFTALAPCLGGEQAAAEMRRVAEAQGVAPG